MNMLYTVKSGLGYDPTTKAFVNEDMCYVEQFWLLSADRKVKFMEAYRNKYGEAAYKYTVKTYLESWLTRPSTLTSTQRQRIVALMPSFASDECRKCKEQVKLEAEHRQLVLECISSVRETVAKFDRLVPSSIERCLSRVSSLQEALDAEIQLAKNLQLHGRFFVADQLDQYYIEAVAKYLILESIRIKFQALSGDLLAIKSLTQNLQRTGRRFQLTHFENGVKNPIQLNDSLLSNFGLSSMQNDLPILKGRSADELQKLLVKKTVELQITERKYNEWILNFQQETVDTPIIASIDALDKNVSAKIKHASSGAFIGVRVQVSQPSKRYLISLRLQIIRRIVILAVFNGLAIAIALRYFDPPFNIVTTVSCLLWMVTFAPKLFKQLIGTTKSDQYE